MSWQSAILLGWTAMHGYFAVFCAGIWLARPKDRSALVLLALVASMAAFICAGVLRSHAADGAQVQLFALLRAWLAATQAALFVDFVARLMGDGASRWVRLGYAVLALTIVFGVVGRFYEAVPPSGFEPGWVPRPTPLRIALAGLALVAPAVMAHRMLRSSSPPPGSAGFSATLILMMGLAVHDLIKRLAGLPTVYLFDHALVLVSAVLTHVLLLQSQEVSARLRRQNRALGEQMVAIAQARDGIREAAPLAAVGELAAMLAKEVEAPLRAVREGASALERRADTAAWQRMDAAIARLDRLVENLLGQTRPVTPVRVWSLLSELLHDAVDGSRMPGGHRPQVELSEAVRSCEVFVDPALMHDALRALIDAVREVEGGTVLQADRDRTRGGVRVQLSVERAGPNIPRSLGLALPFAARVLSAHGGEVDALLGDRRGACVWLPEDACRLATGDAA